MPNAQMMVPTKNAHNTFQSLCFMTLPVVEHFIDDLLLHDAQCIFKYPGRPFVHTAYKNGTHLYFLPTYSGSNESEPYLFGHQTPLGIAKEIYELLRDSPKSSKIGLPLTYTHYDGSYSREVSHEECVAIYHDAYRSMERAIPITQRAIL